MRVRMPADIEREDRILAGLTARQLVIIGVPALATWALLAPLLDTAPLPVLVGVAVPVLGASTAAALVKRDGLSLDRLALAAWRFRRSARRRSTRRGAEQGMPSWVAAQGPPLPAPLDLPVSAVGEDGVIDLAEHGCAVLLSCSTVNFHLRTEQEQAALVAGFGAFLNSLACPVQFLVRAEAVRLDPLVAALDAAVPSLPHPALQRAARDHADFIDSLAEGRDLLYRQVLLVLREPAGKGRHGAATVRRRAEDAVRALAAAGSSAVFLDGARAAAVLAAAANPTDPNAAPPEGQASPEAVITGPGWRED